jgi:p-aminobenzoyl-glutamate transporter AbgT
MVVIIAASTFLACGGFITNLIINPTSLGIWQKQSDQQFLDEIDKETIKDENKDKSKEKDLIKIK